MSSIVVTGAAGFIGSHTVDQLLENGHEVVGVDNFRTGHRKNLAEAEKNGAFRFEEADCADEAQMEAVMAKAKPEAVIHLAALVSVQESLADPNLNFRLNVHATHAVASAAQKAGARRLVFASSAAVYGNQQVLPIREEVSREPISPYGAAKLASEYLLRGYGSTYGMTIVCNRYFNVFGPRQDPGSPYSGVISIFEKRFREGKPVVIFGNGRQTRDFISVHDVARANVIGATGRITGSCVQNICTGRQTSLLDLVRILSRLFPDHPAPEFKEERAGDIHQSFGNPARARKTLNFQAEIDVSTALRELVGGTSLDRDRRLDPRADLTAESF
jgi:UDP-glucose 4-epimerase